MVEGEVDCAGETGSGTNRHLPSLSIVVPVYNVEKYLAECIESVIDQCTGHSIEIILVDDCSTDGCKKIIDEFAQKYGGLIKVVTHSENSGLSAARNSGLDVAQGEYIWFLDSDDKLLPSALGQFYKIIARSKPDIILCDYSEDGVRNVKSFHGPAETLGNGGEILLRGVFRARKMHSWSKITRRSIWGNDLRFPVGRIFEDIATTPWLLLRARSHYYAAEQWVFYRQRDDSILARVARSRHFDEHGHDMLATSLAGYKEYMHNELGDVDHETRFAISHFIARSFTQIGYKLLRTRGLYRNRRENGRLLGRYLSMTEAASPLSYKILIAEYLKRRWFMRLLFLRLFYSLARTD